MTRPEHTFGFGGAGASLKMRGAYLEVIGDLLGSVAVIVAAVVIAATGWTPIDAIASLVIAALIVPRTRALLREAVDVLPLATPGESTLTRATRTARRTTCTPGRSRRA